MKKRGRRIFLIFVGIVLVFLAVMLFLFVSREKVLGCGDGTPEGNCSLRKPYFCLNGTLVKRASSCGCPEILTRKGDLCFSKYQSNPKNITLEYVLRGEKGEIDFTVYEGMVNYVSELPQSFYYFVGENLSRQDFKLRKINEKEQREMFLPLVTEIQNIAEDKNDQVRIAVSVVQNIPYGESEKSIRIGFREINYSLYAYEVLYDMKGACEGKSELLAFLLKEMGYGVVLFYYPLENHEVVGVKCPVEYGLENTGYCFVETTGRSIISNDREYYLGWGELSPEPDVVFISDGDSLGENLYEYKDARKLIELNEIIEEKGELNIFQHNQLESLREKYGLDNI